MKERIEAENIILQTPNAVDNQYVEDFLQFMNTNRSHLLPYLDLALEKVTGDEIGCFFYIKSIAKNFEYGKAFFYFIYDKKNNLIGGVEAKRFGRFEDQKFEISIGLGKSHCGGSYSKEVMSAVEDEFLSCGANRFVLRCCVDNIASNKSAVKLGYVLEGTEIKGSYLHSLEKFVDMNVYSKVKEE